MSRFLLTVSFVVDVADEQALRDAAFTSAKAFEDSIPGDTYDATDSMVQDTRSALLHLSHQAIQQLPGVTLVVLPAEGAIVRVEPFDGATQP